MEGEPDRVAKPGREEAFARSVGLVSDDGGSSAILLTTRVAGRADGHVQPPIGAERDRAGPVVLTGGKIGDDDAGVARDQAGGIVGEAHDTAGLGHVEGAPVESQAVGEIEPGGHHHEVVGPAVAVAIGQGENAAGGRHGDEHDARRVDRQRARRAEADGELIEAKARGKGDRGLVGAARDQGDRRRDQKDARANTCAAARPRPPAHRHRGRVARGPATPAPAPGARLHGRQHGSATGP
jgi:hypothetical protein